MRFGGLIFALLVLPIVACKILPEGLDQPPPAVTEAAGITETALAGGEDQAAVKPKAQPASLTAGAAADVEPGAEAPATDAVPVEPIVQKSEDQITCEKHGGNWATAGRANLKSCIKRTRDAGKQCHKAGDCTSACLARSNTCAPVKPLFGCNDILQKDGSRVTLCID